MNDLEREQLVVFLVDGTTKVETSVTFVHDLRLFPLEERARLLLAREYYGDELANDLLLCLVRIGQVPFLEAQFALTAKQQYELNLFKQNIFVI